MVRRFVLQLSGKKTTRRRDGRVRILMFVDTTNTCSKATQHIFLCSRHKERVHDSLNEDEWNHKLRTKEDWHRDLIQGQKGQNRGEEGGEDE